MGHSGCWVPLLPPSQDRDDRRGRRRHDRRAELADAIRRFRHHGIVPRGDFDIPEPGLNYRLAGHPLRARDPTAGAARAAARGARAGGGLVHGAARAPCSDASAAAGDRHGWQAYVVHSTGGRRRCRRFGPRDRGADRHVRVAPPRRLSRPRPLPRRRPRFRTGARASVRDDDDGERVRPRRGRARPLRLNRRSGGAA